MTATSSAERQTYRHIGDLDIVERARDLAEERYATTGDHAWSTLVEVCEEMIAGDRSADELPSWAEQFGISEQLVGR